MNDNKNQLCCYCFADCGQNVTATLEFQNITSPGWPSPNNIINNRNCMWTITAELDARIELRFEEFKTEGCCDYVEVWESNIQKKKKTDQRQQIELQTQNLLMLQQLELTAYESIQNRTMKTQYCTVLPTRKELDNQ